MRVRLISEDPESMPVLRSLRFVANSPVVAAGLHGRISPREAPLDSLQDFRYTITPAGYSSRDPGFDRVVIVLPGPAVGILRRRLEDRNGSAWVFPADTKSGHVVDPRKSWARVLRRSGIRDLRPHDLRRTLGSWQAIDGASLQIIGQTLGHSDSKATSVYARLQVDPIRDWVRR